MAPSLASAPVKIAIGNKLGSTAVQATKNTNAAAKKDNTNLVFYDDDCCMEERRASLARYRVA